MWPAVPLDVQLMHAAAGRDYLGDLEVVGDFLIANNEDFLKPLAVPLAQPAPPQNLPQSHSVTLFHGWCLRHQQ